MAEILFKELSFQIVGAAMEVHTTLGPGFLEEIYQKALQRELILRKITFVPQSHVKVDYKGEAIADYYLDLVVEGKVCVELKAVSQLAPVHESQVISYLKASKLKLGLLFNFGETSLKHKRIVL